MVHNQAIIKNMKVHEEAEEANDEDNTCEVLRGADTSYMEPMLSNRVAL